MAVHQLKYRGREVAVSVSPTVSTVSEGATRADIQTKVRHTGNSYYLIINNIILTERKPCISIQAQAMDLISVVNDQECVLLIPFDTVVYMARLINGSDGAVVTEESLITIDDVQHLHNADYSGIEDNAIYYVSGGKLTEELIHTNVAEQLVHPKTGANPAVDFSQSRYALKKKEAVDPRIIAIIALILAMVGIYFYSTYEPKQEEIVEAPIEVAPDVGAQIQAFAVAMNKGNALVLHKLLRITADARMVSYQGEYTGGQTDYRRLKEIASNMGGQLDVLGAAWRIHSVKLDFVEQEKTSLRAIQENIDQLIMLEAEQGFQLTIGTSRASRRFTERIDTIVYSKTGLRSSDFATLGKSLHEREVMGQLSRAEVGRTTDGLWRTAKIEFVIRGN